MNRRDTLRGLCGLSIASLGGCVIGSKGSKFFGATGRPLGVQLYSVAAELRQDLDGVLAQIARMGYRHVELAGLLGHSATDMAEALKKAGLVAISAHIPNTTLFVDGGVTLQDMDKVIEDAKTLNLKYVILPVIPVSLSAVPGDKDFLRNLFTALESCTRDDYLRCAELLNEKGALLAKSGIRMGYHNHNFEFAPLDDTTGFELLMRNTDPKLVTFEMDAGWVQAAGMNPIELLKRYPGRFKAMHVKDIQGSTKPNFVLQQVPAEVGSGIMPWPQILSAAFNAGVTDFFVEQEPPFAMPPLRSIEKSSQYLNSLAA
jgi:sugar phosphate isomerase/epimerase